MQDQKIRLDEGFLFGLGAFETIALEGRPLWLERHLKRLERTLAFLGIPRQVTRKEVYEYLESEKITEGALKIVVSEKNRLFLPRENPYMETDYEKGFSVDFAEGRRNEHSPLTYHKTLNYGDCILEKRRAAERGFDEAVFLNSRGEICEGCVSNLFFVREGKLVTPKLSCGLLPGIVREVLLERCDVTEERILAGDIVQFEECFLTNSLMGVMPVVRFGSHFFKGREMTDQIRNSLKTGLTCKFLRAKIVRNKTVRTETK
ncbi:MAG: branched-chain amino acid aminotransferase [Lachnospiraceae bacterium]|nr:branched-chain amino acid aminotransferase [Lachnospiraceae bacterium]